MSIVPPSNDCSANIRKGPPTTAECSTRLRHSGFGCRTYNPLPRRRVRPMPADPVARGSFILHKFSRGGSDRVAAYLARGFADAGMVVDLIAFSRGGEVESILSEL